jgi:Zn-dependent protease with chaperone function
MQSIVVLVGVGILAFLTAAVGPLYVMDRFRDLREPTDPERATMDAMCRKAGLGVDRVAILEEVSVVDVSVRGPPRRRVLFVTEPVVNDLEADVAVGLLAAETGRVQAHFVTFRAAAVAVVVVLFAAITTTVVAFTPGFTALLVVGLTALWAGRRVYYAADAHAADTVGAGQVADAFERAADRSGVTPATGDYSTWLEIQPPLGDRIAALRRQAGERASGE